MNLCCATSAVHGSSAEIKVSVGAPWLLRGEHDFHAESGKSNVEPELRCVN